jgi:phosphoribosylpyrophosphate synthetase
VFHQQRVSPREIQNLKTKLQNIKNAIIINDEIDTGGIKKKAHRLLEESGILDMEEVLGGTS